MISFRKRRQLLGVGLLGLCLMGSLARAAGSGSAYDELMDPQTGKPRPWYAKIYKIYLGMSEDVKLRFLRDSKREFRGDNALDPLPRVFPADEVEMLRRGIELRGTAIRKFLQDYYAGNPVVYQLVPKDVLDRIVERSGEMGYRGRVRPESIAFPYGPDIVRVPSPDPPGFKFAVLEDNPGYIGGPGDLMQARDTLFHLQPAYSEAIAPLNHPEEYYRAIVERARARAIPKTGKLVMYMVPPYPDNEDVRLKKIYGDLGVEVITPNTQHRLVVKPEGVFIQAKDSLERVGFVLLSGEHKWIDTSDPVAREQYAVFEAQAHLGMKTLKKSVRRELEAASRPNPVTHRVSAARIERVLRRSNFRNGVPEAIRLSAQGLIEALLSGKVAANYCPGVDFVGDKEFYLYVDDLVRHYEGVEPIVSNLASFSFRGDTQRKLKQVFSKENFRNYVIKVVDGRGGDGIYIGPKLKPTEIPEIRAKIRARPEGYIAQEYQPLSQLGGLNVDVRGISDIGPDNTYVSTTFWSRGVPASGDGKVNLGQHGRELAVFSVAAPTSGDCIGHAIDAQAAKY